MLNRGVVYIDKTKIDFFMRGMSSILTLSVPNEIASNMEILNRDGLDKLIKVFIEQNKIPPSLIHFVLSSNILFEKNFDVQKTPNIDEDIKSFLDIAPFENPLPKRIVQGAVTKVVVVNADYITAIKDILESSGFQLDSVLLHFEINPNAPSQNTLSNEDIAIILNKFESIRQLSMVQAENYRKEESLSQSLPSSSLKKSKSLPALLGIFGILIILFIVLLLRK